MAKVVGNSYSNRLSPTEQQRSVYLFQGNTRDLPLSALGAPLTYSAQGVKANYDPSLPTPTGDNFDLDDLFASRNWSHPVLDQYDLTAVNGVINRNTIPLTSANYYDPTYGETDAKRRSRLG